MKKIGYIISERKPRKIPDFIGVVKSEDEITDINVPRIYVGFDFTKSKFPSAKCSDRKISDNTFWTFARNERRNEHDSDMSCFFSLCISRMIGTLRYFYINLATIPFSKLKDMLRIVNNSDEKCIYISGSMIYVYQKEKDYVFGVNMDIAEYFNCNRNKIYKMLSKNDSNKIMFGEKWLDDTIKASVINKKYAIAYFMANM